MKRLSTPRAEGTSQCSTPEQAWEFVKDEALRMMKEGRVLRTIEKGVENKIARVTEKSIYRLSSGPKSKPKAISHQEIKNIFAALQRNEKLDFKNKEEWPEGFTYYFSFALVLLIPGVTQDPADPYILRYQPQKAKALSLLGKK